jgi:6-hydroxynicotinate reductase
MSVDAASSEARTSDGKVRCDACPVMCYVKPGMTGACDRYANQDGQIVRVDPHVLLRRTIEEGGGVVPFHGGSGWDGQLLSGADTFVTAIGAGTTYPDYKPAPFIVSSEIDGVDMVTVVTEGIFSYCGVKLKIDTDRHLGPEQNTVRAQGEPVGHVTTGEYGSQMLSLGGVRHLTGGGKKEGRVTCETLLDLCNGKPVELTVDEGATVMVQAGQPPIVNGVREERMRVGCGSATIGMFARQWFGKVDEVVVVDDHITGVLSEHYAGRYLGVRDTGVRMKGRRSTPGRYFQVAEPGTGWGGTDISDPLSILEPFNPKHARPGLTMLMVSTTGEQHAFYRLDEALRPVQEELPEELRVSVERIKENCEPALCTVLFMAGAGGSLRAGVTENPVRLTLSVKEALTAVTCGGAPVYIWPGGGITFMVDVTRVPVNAFGYVPTPALVAPIEFTMRLSDYAGLGGHLDQVRPLASLRADAERRAVAPHAENPWPFGGGR